MKQIINSETIFPAAPRVALLVMLLLSSFTLPVYSRDKSAEADGIIIEYKEPFHQYQYSQLINSAGVPGLVLLTNQQDIASTVVFILDKAGIPYQELSKSPATFQTDWISWHYDAKTKKTVSQPRNRFFKEKTRDKYRFRLSIRYIGQQPNIMLDEVSRRALVDITADTEMSWYVWKQQEPVADAVKAFLKRLQTEYETVMLQTVNPVMAGSVAPVRTRPIKTAGPITPGPAVAAPAIPAIPTTRAEAPVQKVRQTYRNYLPMNLDPGQSWAQSVRQLKLKSIPLSSVHNEQHILSSGWVYAEFNAATKQLDTTSKEVQRHKFQLMVIPGSTSQTSSVFVYHTAFQQKTGPSTWSDKKTQPEIADAFLNFLDLKP